jgi:hypothetical protein
MFSRISLVIPLLLLIPEISRATSIVESTFGEFGDTLLSRSILPPGVDDVTGAVTITAVVGVPPVVVDDDDYIAFTDLVPGSAFSIVAEILDLVIASFQVLDSSGNAISPEILVDKLGTDPPNILAGLVPSSGEIVIEVDAAGGSGYYHLSLDAPRVPEPSTACLLAAGLVALAQTRRRSKRNRSCLPGLHRESIEFHRARKCRGCCGFE